MSVKDELVKEYFPKIYEIIESKKEKTLSDTAIALAEGLSTATSLAQVRTAAKNVLGGEEE